MIQKRKIKKIEKENDKGYKKPMEKNKVHLRYFENQEVELK